MQDTSAPPCPDPDSPSNGPGSSATAPAAPRQYLGPEAAQHAALASLGGLVEIGEREDWLRRAEREAERRYARMLVSTQAQLLLVDVRRSYLAGAWASVIVLGQSAIEATLRDLQFQDHKTPARDLFFGQEDLEQIRQLRNELVHPAEPGSPSKVWIAAGGDVAATHAGLQASAQLAYRLALEALYSQAEQER